MQIIKAVGNPETPGRWRLREPHITLLSKRFPAYKDVLSYLVEYDQTDATDASEAGGLVAYVRKQLYHLALYSLALQTPKIRRGGSDCHGGCHLCSMSESIDIYSDTDPDDWIYGGGNEDDEEEDEDEEEVDEDEDEDEAEIDDDEHEEEDEEEDDDEDESADEEDEGDREDDKEPDNNGDDF